MAFSACSSTASDMEVRLETGPHSDDGVVAGNARPANE
jgi:hypothetical protein